MTELADVIAQVIADHPNMPYADVCDTVYAELQYVPTPAEVRIAVKIAMANDE